MDFAPPAIIVRLYELWRHFYGVFDGEGGGEEDQEESLLLYCNGHAGEGQD